MTNLENCSICENCKRPITSTQSEVVVHIFKLNKNGGVSKRQFRYGYHVVCQPRLGGKILH